MRRDLMSRAMWNSSCQIFALILRMKWRDKRRSCISRWEISTWMKSPCKSNGESPHLSKLCSPRYSNRTASRHFSRGMSTTDAQINSSHSRYFRFAVWRKAFSPSSGQLFIVLALNCFTVHNERCIMFPVQNRSEMRQHCTLNQWHGLMRLIIMCFTSNSFDAYLPPNCLVQPHFTRRINSNNFPRKEWERWLRLE